MSILSEIIDWAVEQTNWKQDAIRRIIEQGNYTDEDVSEISKILLHKNGFTDSALSPVLIDKDKFQNIENTNNNKVILKKIESPKNVNALFDKAKLQFALEGITIIYGENGVGKSGYSRILKKCCKAREVDNIFPNIFTEEKTVPGTATIFYSYNDQEKKLDWVDGQCHGGELEQLVVHDNKCGKIQVTDKNELIYLPSGMDIFKKLIDCFGEVKKEIEKLKPQEAKLNLEKIDKTTNIYSKMRSISKTTDKETISKDFEWLEEYDKKLFEISKKIIDTNEDEIKKKIISFEKEIKYLENIKDIVEKLEKPFSHEKIKNAFEMLKNKKESQTALDKLTTDIQKEEMLEGTGSPLWQVMYSAAVDFSKRSTSQNLPYPSLNGQCVLCQQSLDENAREKMESFSKFAEEKVKKVFDNIVNEIDTSLKSLESLKKEIDLSKLIFNNNFLFIPEENCKLIIKHLDVLNNQRLRLIKCLENKLELKIDDFKLKDSILEKLDHFILVADEKKKEAEKSINSYNLISLKKEKLELDSLKIANIRLNEIHQYIDYLNDLEKFDNMWKELDHGAISRKSSIIITNSLKDSFLRAIFIELEKMGGDGIPLLVNSSTTGGKPIFQLSLKGSNIPKECKLDSILSEGEQKNRFSCRATSRA